MGWMEVLVGWCDVIGVVYGIELKYKWFVKVIVSDIENGVFVLGVWFVL